jgi:hypothetical protein
LLFLFFCSSNRTEFITSVSKIKPRKRSFSSAYSKSPSDLSALIRVKIAAAFSSVLAFASWLQPFFGNYLSTHVIAYTLLGSAAIALAYIQNIIMFFRSMKVVWMVVFLNIYGLCISGASPAKAHTQNVVACSSLHLSSMLSF